MLKYKKTLHLLGTTFSGGLIHISDYLWQQDGVCWIQIHASAHYWWITGYHAQCISAVYLVIIATKCKITAAVKTFQSCKVLFCSIIKHYAVIWCLKKWDLDLRVVCSGLFIGFVDHWKNLEYHQTLKTHLR